MRQLGILIILIIGIGLPITAALYFSAGEGDADWAHEPVLAEPSDEFQAAWLDYLGDERRAAAAHIDAAAYSILAFLEASEDAVNQDAIISTYENLSELAQAFRAGDHIPVPEINLSFASALRVLARQQVALASSLASTGDGEGAGAVLDVAANNLRFAFGWAGLGLSEGDVAVLEDIRRAAQDLMDDATSAERRERAFAALQRFDRQLVAHFRDIVAARPQ